MSRLIVIVGPTAGGKSELAVALAQRLGGEVISADAMQVYRGMEAGTAKPSAALRQGAVHHLLDIAEPTQRFTVADWLRRAEPIVQALLGAQRWPIVVGGTNLYIKALLEGMFEGPSQDERIRAELETLENEQLHQRLRRVDPAAAERIHVNDRKKMVRAIEVFEMTGQAISALQQQWGGAYRYDTVLIGLDWPVEAINRRINARVKAMFQTLPEEVRELESAGRLGSQAREALGYKQVLAALRGQTSMDEAMEQTKILTRQFAKRQRTWLKRYRNVRWLAAEGRDAATLAQEALVRISSTTA